MCASYGLGGQALPERLDFEPLDVHENYARLARWFDERGGTAKITGRRARNLNPVIHSPHERGARELAMGWWWLWVGGAPAEFSAFNSRDDRLTRSWRRAFQHRALLPATWYVEKGQRFEQPDGVAFGIAAITTTVELDDGTSMLTYSMVTREAVGQARDANPRMPLMLPRDFHDRWLDPDQPGDENLRDAAVAASTALAHSATTREATHGATTRRPSAADADPRRPHDRPTLF